LDIGPGLWLAIVFSGARNPPGTPPLVKKYKSTISSRSGVIWIGKDASGSAEFQLCHTPDNLACFDARWESYIEQGHAAIPYLLELGKFTFLRSLWYEVDGNNAYIESFFPAWIVNALTLHAKETLEELGFVIRSNWEILEKWKGVVDIRVFCEVEDFRDGKCISV
jgi:hypothetical protein